MNRHILIYLTLLTSSGFIFGQGALQWSLNSHFIRQNSYGNVYFETPVLNYLSELENIYRENGRILKTEVTEFYVPQAGDSSRIKYSRYFNNDIIFVPETYEFRDSYPNLRFPEIADNFNISANKVVQISGGKYDISTIKYNATGQVASIEEKKVLRSAGLSQQAGEKSCGRNWRFTYEKGKIKKIKQDEWVLPPDENETKTPVPFQIDFQYDSGLMISEISYAGRKVPLSPYLCADSLRKIYNRIWEWKWNAWYHERFTEFVTMGLLEMTFCVYKNGVLKEILYWSENRKSSIVRLIVACDETGKITKVTDRWSRIIYEYDPTINRLAKRTILERHYASNQNYWEIDEKTLEIVREVSESYYYDTSGRVIKTTGEDFNISNSGSMRDKKNYKRTGKLMNYSLKEP